MEGQRPAQSLGRRIGWNFGLLATGRAVGDFCLFLLIVVVSRLFGPEGVGEYSFAIALTGFFAVFADFGLYSLTVKELSRASGTIGAAFGPILLLRTGLSITVLVALVACTTVFSFHAVTSTTLISIGLYQVALRLIDGFAALFLARDDVHLAAILEISCKALVALSAITLAVLAHEDFVVVIASLPVVALLHVLAALLVATGRYGWPRLTSSLASLLATARSALPYALSTVLAQISSRTDVVLLGLLLGSAAAGTYNAAYRFVFLFLLVAQFAANSIFPHASRLWRERELGLLYSRSMRLVLLAALPLSAALFLIAPSVVTIVFGRDFAEAGTVVRVLCGVLIVGFLARIMGVFLMSCDLEEYRMRSQGWAAAVNVASNLILIPTLGIQGAAVATLSSEVVLALLFGQRLLREVGSPRVASRLAIGVTAVVVAVSPFLVLRDLSWWVEALGVSALYVAVLALFKDVRRTEFRYIAAALRPSSATAGTPERG